MEQKRPIGFAIAVAAAAAVLPVILLVEATTSRGDGYGGAGAMLLAMVLALGLTVGGVVVGFRRGERFSWLAIVAVLLWCMPIMLMF
ncbi:MAG: hypothetical protein JNM45_09975 [Rhizobiales bacterium]|nr:hypothetical protein [Hyphomicrobiales bacterium]